MIEVFHSKTKMVCTMGPACTPKDILLEMSKVGLDVCRINMSHGTQEQHQKTIDLIKEINAEHDLNLSILIDLQGPKLRIGKLEQPYPIQKGDIIELCTAIQEQEGNRLPMVYETFARDVHIGDLILVDDGKVELKVLESNGTDTVKLVVAHGEEIGSKKGVNLPYVKVSLPSITEKDLSDIDFALRNGVHWIALSFVRTAMDIIELRRYIERKNSKARIIAKIEKPEALRNIDSIIEATDAVMVARGDLGVEIYLEEVPIWQKIIVSKCNIAGKPVIVATQMLESMIENKRPTRAETTDVANAVLDGADALMLSGETSVGKHPVEVVRVMQSIISKAEQQESIYHRNMTANPESPTFLADATCVTAVKLALETNAKAIVSMTSSGYTAFQLSRCRPKANIYIFTDNRTMIKTLSLVWGVRAFYYDQFKGTNETIDDVLNLLEQDRILTKGDVVINTASIPLHARKRTNMLKVTVIE